MAKEKDRTATSVTLGVAIPKSEDFDQATRVPWPLACLISAITGVFFTWLVAVSIATVAWFDFAGAPFSDVFSLGTKIWLLGHGSGAVIAGSPLTITPLGLSLINLMIVIGCAFFAVRQTKAKTGKNLTQRQRAQKTLLISIVVTGCYLGILVGIGLFTLTIGQVVRTLLGGFMIPAVATFVAAKHTFSLSVKSWLPNWLKGVGKAIFCAQTVMIFAGALITLIAVANSREQQIFLFDSLYPTTSGGVVLLLIQLMWLPNIILWSASWLTGAGFSVGVDTVVSPSSVAAGAMPGLPIFGAIPPNGVYPEQLWWLFSPVVAGLIAGMVAVMGRQLGLAKTCLIAGLVGVGSGLVFCLLAGISAGDLGVNRMTNLGPRFPELLVLAPVLMGLSAMVSGILIGLISRKKSSVEHISSNSEDNA